MVLIESTELLEQLSFLLKISQEFRLDETSKAYEDIIRHIISMENEVFMKEGRFENFRSYRNSLCITD